MLARGAASRLLAATLSRVSPAAELSLERQCSSAAASTSAPSSALTQKLAGLSDEQRKHLEAMRYLAQRPLDMAHSASMLAALTATYRDLYVVMDAMHKRDILGIPRPLVEEPPPAPVAAETGGTTTSSSGTSTPESASVTNSTQSFYPIRDLTKLPDPPDSGLELKEEYMGRQPAWQQLLPNHLEVCYQLNTFIYLWPAMESYMPLFVDFTDVHQLLKKRVKRGKAGARRRRKPKPHTNLRHFYNSPDLR